MTDTGIRRVFLLIVDSMGCGSLPDADRFGDTGSNTLNTISYSEKFHCPNMEKLGLFSVDGFKAGEPFYRADKHPLKADGTPAVLPEGVFGRLAEVSAGKDTTAGHWEIAGLVMPRPFPTYPEGFPPEVIREFEEKTGRGTLCNLPYSGTEVIRDYGEEHMRTGKLIVYTSADSVLSQPMRMWSRRRNYTVTAGSQGRSCRESTAWAESSRAPSRAAALLILPGSEPTGMIFRWSRRSRPCWMS